MCLNLKICFTLFRMTRHLRNTMALVNANTVRDICKPSVMLLSSAEQFHSLDSQTQEQLLRSISQTHSTPSSST